MAYEAQNPGAETHRQNPSHYTGHNPQRSRFSSPGQGRSTPTGWQREKGEVRAQELEFDNGYRVLAVQVPGQKAVIKGAGPWADFLKHQEDSMALVEEWLGEVEKETPTTQHKSHDEEEPTKQTFTDRRTQMFGEGETYTGPRRRRNDFPAGTQVGPTRLDSLERVVIALATSVESLRQEIGRTAKTASAPSQEPPSTGKS